MVDWQLDSISRGKTYAWVVLDRFLKRNDFADEDDARANIVDWLEQLVGPQDAPLVQIPATPAAATTGAAAGAVDSDASTAEIVSDVVVEIVSDFDWIDMVAGWFTDDPA
ncbi:hypothetical protein [Burkholderia diffusa]|uniref:hypothetical protein n=1 Tax=Burkholderia diffusa TaxID=488732 RepID=UPI001E39AD30|nr:hypothetical protein [Burkholderia diffusa]